MGRPLALAGGAASLEPGGFLSSALEIYKPHALEATKVLGIVAIPVALLNAAASLIPAGLGGLLTLVGAIALGLFNLLVGMGALGEFTMRLAAGVPMTAPQALKLQVGRMFPWLLGILLPAFLAGIGAICLIPVILFGFFLIQVYMVERDKSGVDINKRVFELVQKEPVMVAVLLGIAIAVGLVFGLASFILALLPFVGAPAAALLSGVFTAAFAPIINFLGFRLYFAIRQKHENIDAAAVARSQLTPVT